MPPQSTCMMKIPSQEEEEPSVWIFGYGSLLWKPQIQFASKQTGFIKDFVRTFNLGNVTFRGRPGKPGRVAIVEKEKGSMTWGVAYEVKGREEIRHAIEQLDEREIGNGGYMRFETTFYPRGYSPYHCCQENTANGAVCTVPCLVYTAKTSNDLYLGSRDLNYMVYEILMAKGTAGPNQDYVLKIADYVRKCIPEDKDRLLFALDAKIKEGIDNLELEREELEDVEVEVSP